MDRIKSRKFLLTLAVLAFYMLTYALGRRLFDLDELQIRKTCVDLLEHAIVHLYFIL